MLHALNPYGFAWFRRVDADNVDPNRNFLLPDQGFSGSAPLYGRLDALLNPSSPPGSDAFVARMLLARLRHGEPALRQALVTGQHDFPKGLFFAGRGRSVIVDTVDAHFDDWLGAPRLVVHLDLHTGLGRYGAHKLLVDAGLPDADVARMVEWFGASTLEQDDPRRTSYRARGTFGAWCRHRAAPTPYLYGCAEFGTYGPVRMLAGLRAENRAVHWGETDDPVSRHARLALRELFCPASPAWRRRALDGARGLIDRAVGLLAA